LVFLDDTSLQKPVMQAMLDKGISLRRGIMCAHRESPYRAGWSGASLSASERATDTGLIIPLYPDMTDEQIETVAGELTRTVSRS
ncbi:MAG: DegT/DnrJ/EryC1/StrS family aminotransferase, partial [Nitrospinae bacterium]|nr:DegT/DnrJ/EryC1/StrS family aminotransferase [Nitrospinota bacterium]